MTIALVVGGPDPEAVMEDTWGGCSSKKIVVFAGSA